MREQSYHIIDKAAPYLRSRFYFIKSLDKSP